MKNSFIKSALLLFTLIAIISHIGCSQTNSNKQSKDNRLKQKVGGPCEGCEAIYESPVPFDELNNTDTLPDYTDQGAKIKISGIVYQRDGKTPAQNVVLYAYHTNQEGVYPKNGTETGWGKRHGYIRGWVKTDKNGFYQFYTLKPGAYPGRNDPAHIHFTIKEPGLNEYYIDDIQFDDDPLLTSDKRKTQQNLGGDGIIKLAQQGNGIFLGTRNVILGLNIPAYPRS